MFPENSFKKWSKVVALSLFVLTLFLGFNILNLRFDYDFEKFFPAEDKEADFFYAHREQFEADNNFLLIAIERKEGLFDLDFLRKVERFRKEIEKLPNVKGARAITNQDEVFINSFGGAFTKPYIQFKKDELKNDSVRIFRAEELVNTLVAEDGKSLCVFLKHENVLSKKKSDALVDGIEAIYPKYKFERVRMAGTTVGQKYYIYKMNYELFLFVGLSGLLIVIFLFISFCSLWGVIVPLIVIASALVWVLGGMGLFDVPMNILLTTLPSIMFVVSMSDVIHLVSRYIDALRDKHTAYESIWITVKEVGYATFLTSFTTSVGFGTLYFVNVEPVKIFGLVIAVGVLIAYLLSIVLLPILFYYTKPPRLIEKGDDSYWRKMLPKWHEWNLKNKWKIIGFYVVVTVVSLIGMSQLKTDNLIMDDIRDDDPIKVDFNFLDTHFGGFRPFELVVTVKDTNETVWKKEHLESMQKIEKYLQKDFGVELKGSIVQSISVLNRSANAGNPKYFKVPDDQRSLSRYRRFLKIAGQGKLIRLMVDSTERVTRITGGIPDWGNNKVTAKNEALMKFIKSNNLDKDLDFRLTGSAYLLDKNISYLAKSLLQGLSISILIVSILMGLLYRSFSMMIISVIPNILPLLMIAAIMGFTGLEIKTSTSIIFTIAFGIAVDDTIHLLGKFKFELMKGIGKDQALRNAFTITGKAMILTTLILCSGFMLLLFSDFNGTFFMGLLLSLALLFALILDLTLLPVLLMIFYKEPKTKTDME